MLKAIFVERHGSDNLWEWLRVIRNECADFFTHFKEEITPEMQAKYRRSYHENVRHYLYTNEDGAIVGFSRLEYRDGKVYPTYGLRKAMRGQGYGYTLVAMAILAAGTDLAGDWREDNKAVQFIDTALGWRVAGPVDKDGVQPVVCAWPPPFVTL